jgi:hypothetical protein
MRSRCLWVRLPELSAGAVIAPDDGCRVIRSSLLPRHELIDRGATWSTPVLVVDGRTNASTPAASAIQQSLVRRGLRAILLAARGGSSTGVEIDTQLVGKVLDVAGLARAHLVTLRDGVGGDLARHPRLWSSRIVARMGSEVQVIWLGTQAARREAGTALLSGELLTSLCASHEGDRE